MKYMLQTPQARKEFYDLCTELLGEDITNIIDIRGRDTLELTGAALLLKQMLMTDYPVIYNLMKKENETNE
jgi:hypothetical protein